MRGCLHVLFRGRLGITEPCLVTEAYLNCGHLNSVTTMGHFLRLEVYFHFVFQVIAGCHTISIRVYVKTLASFLKLMEINYLYVHICSYHLN